MEIEPINSDVSNGVSEKLLAQIRRRTFGPFKLSAEVEVDSMYEKRGAAIPASVLFSEWEKASSPFPRCRNEGVLALPFRRRRSRGFSPCTSCFLRSPQEEIRTLKDTARVSISFGKERYSAHDLDVFHKICARNPRFFFVFVCAICVNDCQEAVRWGA